MPSDPARPGSTKPTGCSGGSGVLAPNNNNNGTIERLSSSAASVAILAQAILAQAILAQAILAQVLLKDEGLAAPARGASGPSPGG